MSLPVRVVILEPADKPWPVSGVAIRGKVAWYMRKLQLWTQTEINCTFDWTLHWHRSVRLHEYLSLELKHDGTTKDWRDEEGKGADEAKVMRVLTEEMGFKTEIPGMNVWRWVVIMSHAGGWAGGRNMNGDPNHPFDDTGSMLIGDWNILGCLRKDNPEEMNGDGHAFSHEFAHALGISAHTGNLLPDMTTVPYYLEPFRDGNLTVGQKQQLISKNMRFLRDV